MEQGRLYLVGDMFKREKKEEKKRKEGKQNCIKPSCLKAVRKPCMDLYSVLGMPKEALIAWRCSTNSLGRQAGCMDGTEYVRDGAAQQERARDGAR